MQATTNRITCTTSIKHVQCVGGSHWMASEESIRTWHLIGRLELPRLEDGYRDYRDSV